MREDIAMAPQFRQYAEEFRTIAAYLLNLAADYDRLAHAVDVVADSPSVAAVGSRAHASLAQHANEYANPMTGSPIQHRRTNKNKH